MYQNTVSKTIEIFKTNVCSRAIANNISRALCAADPGCSVHFDLEDCDRVLRIESDTINLELITSLVEAHGHWCEALL